MDFKIFFLPLGGGGGGVTLLETERWRATVRYVAIVVFLSISSSSYSILIPFKTIKF